MRLARTEREVAERQTAKKGPDAWRRLWRRLAARETGRQSDRQTDRQSRDPGLYGCVAGLELLTHMVLRSVPVPCLNPYAAGGKVPPLSSPPTSLQDHADPPPLTHKGGVGR